MDVFTTCFHCISFTEFEKPAKRVFSEELWITCVWTETRLRDTPVRVSRNPHIHVISLPLHVNKTNLASRSFLFFILSNRVKDERLQLREWEILIEQTLRRSDWREWHSRKEREWDYLLSLTPPSLSLSLCSHLPLGECTHSCARSLLVHTRSGLHGAHTHTVCRRWLDCLCWLCTSKKKSLSAGGTVRSFWTGFRGVFMFTRVWGK